MSDDKTEISGNIETTEELEAQKAKTTNPMLEAILAKVNDLTANVNDLAVNMSEGFARVDARLDKVENRLDKIESRLDRIEKDNRESKRNQRVFQDQLLEIQGKQRDKRTWIASPHNRSETQASQFPTLPINHIVVSTSVMFCQQAKAICTLPQGVLPDEDFHR
jgi:chromosome segregation ATPase